MTKTTTLKVYKFIRADHKMNYGDGREITVGKKLSVTGRIALCTNGIHGAILPLDALKYAPGCHLAIGTLGGTLVQGDDKAAGRSFTAEIILDATRILQEFAVWCAEEAIRACQERGIAVDERSIEATRVVRRYLRDEATIDEVDAVYAAVYAAARAAAGADARAAADAAADAARAAVYAAARAAVYAAAGADAAAAGARAAADAADAAARAAVYAARAAVYAAARAAVYAAAGADAAAAGADAAARAAVYAAARAAARAAVYAADAQNNELTRLIDAEIARLAL